jgi:hypothetical protein
MKTESEYRRYAEECRTLARCAGSSTDRDSLLNMAATWEVLAQASAKKLAKNSLPVEE